MRTTRPNRGLCAALLLAAGLSACGTETAGSGLDCFPSEAARWLVGPNRASEFEGRESQQGPVSIYIDSSGSMAGYIDGATESVRPLHDLIGTLPSMLGSAESPVSFRSFGGRIRDIGDGEQSRLLERDYYSCGGREGCDNRETRLDLVLSAIAEQPDSLAIVVTDMWFSDPASRTTGLVPLAAPLEEILAGGRAIAVYGVAAPFAGTIYDLPGGNSMRFEGRRPLIMLAIGPQERVLEFGRLMTRSPSAFLADGMRTGAVRRSLFTLDPSAGLARPEAPLEGGRDLRVQPALILDAIEGVRVQQFQIDRGGALRDPEEPAALPSWEGPDEQAFIPDAVWRGPLATRLRVWERVGERCAPEDWAEPVLAEAEWEEAGEGQEHYELDPSRFVTDFRRPGVYLVTGEIARVSLEQPNPATQWLRDWSFRANQGMAAAIGENGRLFRTLHLDEFARLMENSLAEAAERRPGPISGFTFAVEVTG